MEVLERADVPGGNVRTTRERGYTLDHAANGWLNSEPAMGRLLGLIGLADAPRQAGTPRPRNLLEKR